MDSILSHVDCPNDLRSLDISQLEELAQELRDFIVPIIATTGGHLAPSLGVVELTIVLHYLFNTPDDKIVWDVGHQSYAHKILTGRKELFSSIRQQDGISGFPKISESDYDAFGVGHASTSISSAFGMACARDIQGLKNKVIAVVGDGALTGGLSYEGLNNAGASERDIIVILNDNSMSISPNVGAISKYLTSVISHPVYNKVKNEIWDLTGKLDNMGSVIRKTVRRLQESGKAFMTPGILFEKLGFRYFGPVDGHDISSLVHLFQKVREFKGPIFVHVQTKKGKGYTPAEENASTFHGLGQFDPDTGEVLKKSTIPSYTKVFGDTITELAETNDKIVGITAAMQIGAGLANFAEKFPDRFFDVGIAEGHAVTFAAGLAAQGIKPVCAIYSSFLQRAYDMVLHDVALQSLPVVFALDRAGIVGDDGPTHHGVYDIAMLRTVPNLVIMAPKDENELRHMLYTATEYSEGPVAFRYPRGLGKGVKLDAELTQLPIGQSETLQRGSNVAIIAVGPLVYDALEAAKVLENENGIRASVINARFVKPVDEGMLEKLAQDHQLVITIEDGALKGGFGSEVVEYFAKHNISGVELTCLGIPDEFVEQGSPDSLYAELGLSAEGICKAVRKSNIFNTTVNNQFHKYLEHSKAS
jgi:1-deoxy-D-xylulose-5-phosphate synthase